MSWVTDIFRARAVARGGVVRRKISTVNRYATRSALEREVRRRRFHMVEIGDQYVILCNTGRMKVIV